MNRSTAKQSRPVIRALAVKRRTRSEALLGLALCVTGVAAYVTVLAAFA